MLYTKEQEQTRQELRRLGVNLYDDAKDASLDPVGAQYKTEDAGPQCGQAGQDASIRPSRGRYFSTIAERIYHYERLVREYKALLRALPEEMNPDAATALDRALGSQPFGL